MIDDKILTEVDVLEKQLYYMFNKKKKTSQTNYLINHLYGCYCNLMSGYGLKSVKKQSLDSLYFRRMYGGVGEGDIKEFR